MLAHVVMIKQMGEGGSACAGLLPLARLDVVKRHDVVPLLTYNNQPVGNASLMHVQERPCKGPGGDQQGGQHVVQPQDAGPAFPETCTRHARRPHRGGGATEAPGCASSTERAAAQDGGREGGRARGAEAGGRPRARGPSGMAAGHRRGRASASLAGGDSLAGAPTAGADPSHVSRQLVCQVQMLLFLRYQTFSSPYGLGTSSSTFYGMFPRFMHFLHQLYGIPLASKSFLTYDI